MYVIKKKKLVFKNQVYKVYSNYIKSKHNYVKDFLSLEVKGKKFGGVCCIIIKKKKIGLMKIQSPILQKSLYSLVQGFCNSKENIFQSVKREVLEETGMSISLKKFNYLCHVLPMQSLIDSKLAIFSTKLGSKSDYNYMKRIHEIGSGKLYFFSYTDVKKMLKKPNAFDLISFSALSYFLFLK